MGPPTELEWEWFARGGEVAIQDGTFDTTYAGSDNADEVAWYSNNSGNKTHAVGTKKPNELGIYDCSGNVCEWCYDTSDNGYISEDKPYIYDESIDNRRLKGGSWSNWDCNCEIFSRGDYWTDDPSSFTGFRVVRSV